MKSYILIEKNYKYILLIILFKLNSDISYLKINKNVYSFLFLITYD